ncbi:hypothetical protein D3C87_1223390 [compost metagenome]|jgi:hypothetical protein
MQSERDWRDIPVWRCPQSDVCGEQWATRNEGTSCPFCHAGIGVLAGFTYGDLVNAADHFGFGADLPVLLPEPVPDLVQLSTLPQDIWIGLPVFHPCSQEGTDANWLLYDVGVVLEVYPDPDFPSEFQCRFVTSAGGRSTTLHYQPSNLWIPRALAERLV